MTLSTLLNALAKRSASEATLRAGSEIQICVDGNWRAQNANLTDAALDEIIAKALPLDEEANWRAPNGTANLSAQNYRIEASKNAGAVVITIKRLSKASGQPLSAQAAGELKNSAFSSATLPPTAATAPASAPRRTMASDGKTSGSAMNGGVRNVEARAGDLKSVPSPRSAPAPLTTATDSVSLGVLFDEWHYYNKNGVKFGPVSWAKIRAQISMDVIAANTLVWREGMSEWLPLEQTELNRLLTGEENTPLREKPEEANDSGRPSAVLPKRLEAVNVGAFCLPLLWCYFHNLPIWAGVVFGLSALAALLTLFVPFGWIGLVLPLAAAIYLSDKGNELAWRNRVWASESQFETVQEVWAKYGLPISLVCFFTTIVFLLFHNMQTSMHSMTDAVPIQ